MMDAVEIIYSERFKKQHAPLSDEIKKKAMKAVQLFTENVLHPSLRLHKLSGKLEGLWSISLDKNYRILLRPMKGNVYLFIAIGPHAIYEKNS